MKKNFLVKLCIIFIIFIVSVYGLFLVLPLIASPIINKYTEQVNDEIYKSLGLKSEISDIAVVTTPKLTAGIKIGKFGLNYPDGRKVLNAEGFEVKVSLLKFLTKKIEIDSVSLKNIEALIGVNKDGSLEILKYFPETEEPQSSKTADEPVSLPFGLTLSNKLPDIHIKNHNVTVLDLSNNKKYVFQGGNTDLTDFILNKKFHLKTTGEVLLAGVKQFDYNLDLKNHIMPDMDINELVFNYDNEEVKKDSLNQNFNILEVLELINKNRITANIDTKLTVDGDAENIDLNGFLNADNISVAPNGLVIPPSLIKIESKNNKVNIDSQIYTARDEISTITGCIHTGRHPNIDLNFKSEADIKNLINIVNAVAATFNIKDLQTLSGNGKIDANFNIKSDMKNVFADGYLKIPNARIQYALYNIIINNINADISCQDNNVNVNNVSLSIMNQPLTLKGVIKSDTTTDLVIESGNLSLKGLIIACAQTYLLKENDIHSGDVVIKANIQGKFDKLSPNIRILANNINLKNIPSNTQIFLPNMKINLVSDTKTFSGDASVDNLKAVNPAITVYVPKLNAIIKEDSIVISETPIRAEKNTINLFGEIKNYMSEKILLNFKTTRGVVSTLTGDINTKKQSLNLNFVIPNYSTIVIPGFDKSKLVLKGSTQITGEMVNPILNGVFNVKNTDIPEVPATIENMDVNLNGAILNGKTTITKFTSGGIIAENITSGIALNGDNFYLKNMKGSAFGGTFTGDIVYNLANAKTSVNMSGKGFDAEKTIEGAAGIKHALTGMLDFDTKLNLKVVDYDEMIKSMKGNLNFTISEGSFGEIGKIEKFFHAGNIIANNVLKTTVATLSTLSGINNSAKYDYIKGNLTFSDGWANLVSVKSSGKTLAYYATGKYHILNGTANVVILGRLHSTVVALLGPLGDLSADRILSYIPKLGEYTSAALSSLISKPDNEKISEIPELRNENQTYKDFKVVFNGGIASESSVKSFKWLVNQDTSEFEKINIIDTVKSIKTTTKEDINNTVKTVKDTAQSTKEDVKNAIDAVKAQRDLVKQSAEDIKNLFKF